MNKANVYFPDMKFLNNVSVSELMNLMSNFTVLCNNENTPILIASLRSIADMLEKLYEKNNYEK